MKHEKEGVTRFQLTYKKSAALSSRYSNDLSHWRKIFFQARLIGQDKKRYGGLGFGNMSRLLRRRPLQYIVTGTQTGYKPTLSPCDYAVVAKSDPRKNTVVARGPVAPSSETMTHGMIYDLDKKARYVVHVHSPDIWKNAKKLGLLRTKKNVRYGTPEMTADVKRLFKTKQLGKKKIFSMEGHRDGVVSFGATIEEASLRMLQVWAVAKVMQHKRK